MPAFSRLSYAAKTVRNRSGRGSSRTVISSATPNSPSDPTNSPTRSGPTPTPSTLSLPNATTSPSASQAASSGARYEEALRDVNGGKEGDALKALGELAQTGSGDYPDLARLTAAAAKSRTGDVDGALADYDALAANAADPLMRDLARLKAAMAVLDSASQEEVARRVGDLAATPGPWRNLAREILGLAAYKAGNLALAGSFFEDILADAGASAEIRQRAEVMVSLMATQRLDGEKKPEEKAAQ